jgi:HSP20 family protein
MAMSPFDPFIQSRWDPWRDMTTLREAMNRLLESSFVRPTTAFGTSSGMDVPLDLSETENEFRIQAHLPGMRPEDVHISVHNNVVTLEGERHEEREHKNGGRSLYTEHRYGHFSRSFGLPMSVDANKCKADFRDGVLTLTLPKLETARPRQIPVAGERQLSAAGSTSSPARAARARSTSGTTSRSRARTTRAASARSGGRRRTQAATPATPVPTTIPGEPVHREPVNMGDEHRTTRQRSRNR